MKDQSPKKKRVPSSKRKRQPQWLKDWRAEGRRLWGRERYDAKLRQLREGHA